MNIKIGSSNINYELLSSIMASVETTPPEEQMNSALLREFPRVSENTSDSRMTYSERLGFDFADIAKKNLLYEVDKYKGVLDSLKPKSLSDEVHKYNQILDPILGSTPLFVQAPGDNNSVMMNDVKQQKIGDCWIMGPLAELAAKDPQAIKNMIHYNGDGTYTVTFKERGPGFPVPTVVDRKITVTADFPGGINGNGHAGVGDKNALGQGEIWPLIIEKAYAQYKGGYDKIAGGGDPAEFLFALTGKEPYARGTFSPVPYEDVKNSFDSGKPVLFCTPSDGSLGYGLVNNHCYAVKNIYTDNNGKQWIQLYNPWGNNQPKPIPFNELYNNFAEVVIGG